MGFALLDPLLKRSERSLPAADVILSTWKQVLMIASASGSVGPVLGEGTVLAFTASAPAPQL